MGTAARARPLPLHPMCTIMRPDPAKMKQVPYEKKYKKFLIKKKSSKNQEIIQKKIFKTKQKRPSKIKRFFLKRYTSFSYGSTNCCTKSRNNSAKPQNPANVNIRRSSKWIITEDQSPEKLQVNHRRGSGAVRFRPSPPEAIIDAFPSTRGRVSSA